MEQLPDKIDKGFCLNYARLSYRRKFIRTSIFTLFIPLLFLVRWDGEIFGFPTTAVVWGFLFLALRQAGYVQAGDFSRPLNKTVQKCISEAVTLYGGRKGFTDLMLERRQSLEDVSTWLGHATIERTWRSYKGKQVVRFKRPAA